MMIACPSCATSYMIDPASIGPAGRTVRCAHCKTTWFAGVPKSIRELTAFVDGVIAEAETEMTGILEPDAPPAPAPVSTPQAADDFNVEPPAPMPVTAVPQPAQSVECATPNTTLVPMAEPIVIPDAPLLVPPIEQAPLPDIANAEHDSVDAETFVARRQRLKTPRQKKRRSSRRTALVLLLFALNVALVGARNEVVRYLPQTASLFSAIGLPVNLRNLKFENVRMAKEEQSGVNILIIEGDVVSTASKPVDVPRLRFAERNAIGQEVYTWTALPSRSILQPGERVEFNSRLPSPPAETRDVMVRFFNAQDAAAEEK